MSQRPSPTYVPVKSPRAFEHVCDQIRAQLASGALKPGDKLPPERELAMRFGVSRNVLREALRSLEIAGLIGLKKGGSGGSFILGGDPRLVARAFQDMLFAGTISLSEFTEARTLVLENIIRLACERASEEDFKTLEANVDLTEEYSRVQDYDRRFDTATEFYRLLAASTKNQVLVVASDALTEILQEFLKSTANRPKLYHLIESRRRFMKHLRARDSAKASREMTTYLAGLHQHILSIMEGKSLQSEESEPPRAKKASAKASATTQKLNGAKPRRKPPAI
jgi:GntR family transcriptional repressor for pyruvate dehydrogenase complex